MIPETYQANCIYLYECVELPNKWQQIKPLISNIDAFDSTILKYNNIYWLFTSVLEEKNKNRTLHIYYSNNLLKGKWKEHPINTQKIDSDLKHGSGRGAGYIYEENGSYYRPIQENIRFYGESIKINKILKLTEFEFVEEFHTIITSPYKYGTHHINKVNDYVIMDINEESIIIN